MHMQNTGRKNKELLAIVLLLNAAALGWYGLLFSKIQAKNEHVSALLNKIDAEAAEENLLSSVKALAANTASLREKLLGFAVPREGVVPFIEFLESTGREVGVSVSIESVSTAALPQGTAMESLRLHVTGKGAWSGVVRLFGLLELLPFETSVEQAVVSSEEDDLWRLDATVAVLKDT